MGWWQTECVRVAKFGAVGLSGMVVDFSVFALLLTVLPTGWARGLAIWLAMSWNFSLNRRFTFADAQTDSVWRQYISFCGSCVVGALISWSVCMVLLSSGTFVGRYPLLAAATGVAFGTGTNFLLSRLVVFRLPIAPSLANGSQAGASALARINQS